MISIALVMVVGFIARHACNVRSTVPVCLCVHACTFIFEMCKQTKDVRSCDFLL